MVGVLFFKITDYKRVMRWPRKTLKDAQFIALEKGGECLSLSYVGARKPMTWRCGECLDTWVTSYNKIQQGTWCPRCSGNKKRAIDEYKEKALSRGGKCLSEAVHTNKQPLAWVCREGHRWSAPGKRILRGDWCKLCSTIVGADKIRGNLSDCQELAEQRGGKCLSSAYVNSATGMVWKCSVSSHPTWVARPSALRRGTWCPECGTLAMASKIRGTIDECHEVARRKGGFCLESEYRGNRALMNWRCGDCSGEWRASFANVGFSTWCPYCSASRGEAQCRKILEKLFFMTFAKERYQWLTNSDGNRMELDGYNDELKLAFEYHGKQHYSYIPHYHRNGPDDLKKRQRDDRRKRRLCKENGVKLITIPYTIKPKHLESYILRQLKRLNISTTQHPNQDSEHQISSCGT
jgi:hypothetical protein